jgi:hypothetical protein
MKALVASALFVFFCQAVSAQGPQSYKCAQSAHTCDTTLVQLITPTPNVGGLTGAGNTVTPADFGNQIIRITDANTDSTHPNQSYQAGIASSSDENNWNTNSTFFISDSPSTCCYVYAWNASTLTASRICAANFPTRGGYVTDIDNVKAAFWSRSNPNFLYGYADVALKKIDVSTCPPTVTTIKDFRSATCLGAGYPSNPRTNGEAVDFTDTNFAESFGPQNSTGDVAVYRVGSGCTHLNINTGVVNGDWGSSGSIDESVTAGIHNAKMSLLGDWVVMAVHVCVGVPCNGQSLNIIFWQIGTLHVRVATEGGSGGDPNFILGHWTDGAGLWENSDKGNCNSYNETTRAYDTPSTITILIPSGNCPPQSMPGPLDQHQSWNNDDSGNHSPIFATNIDNGCNGCTMTYAWQNEITAIAPSASSAAGTVYRLFHHYNTNLSNRSAPSMAATTVSQDGRFVLFVSDWQGTLGSEGGSTSCTVGGTNDGTGCRADVFVGVLPINATNPAPCGACFAQNVLPALNFQRLWGELQ